MMPAKHNGNGLPRRKREHAIILLSHGFSCSEVARQLRISRTTIHGLRDREMNQIEQAQDRLSNQWRRVASDAVDRLQDRLNAPAAIPLSALIPLAGVATDKIVALGRGVQLPDLHAHLHQHLHITKEDVQEAAATLMKQLPNE